MDILLRQEMGMYEGKRGLSRLFAREIVSTESIGQTLHSMTTGPLLRL
jgi:hypothetical protein